MMEAPRHPDRAAGALTVAVRAAAGTCGVLSVALAGYVLWRSARLLALLYAAGMVAMVLDRPVAALVRRGLGRAWALAVVLIAAAAITTALLVVAVDPLVTQARELANVAPTIADDLRSALVGRLGGVLEGSPLGTWIHDTLPHGAGALAGSLYGVAGGVANAAGALLTMLVMTVLLLASGPRVIRQSLGALPPPRRPWAEALVRELSLALGGYLAGLATIVAARIVVTGAFLAVARVPFAIPLALMTGVSVLIPYLGSAIRLVIVGSVAWVARGTGSALTAVAFIAAYDLVENYALSPLVFRRALGMSALLQLIAVLFLGYHLGLVGAVLAIPLTATAQILARSLRSAQPAVRGRERNYHQDRHDPRPLEGDGGRTSAHGSREDVMERAKSFQELMREGTFAATDWPLGTGVALVVLGVLSILAPMLSGMLFDMLFGALLIGAGIVELVDAFKAGTWQRGVLLFLAGLVALAAGVLYIDRPMVGLVVLTVVFISYLVFAGAFRLVMAFQLPRGTPGKGMGIASGFVSLGLAYLALAQMPNVSAWLIGTFIGVSFIFAGIARISLALGFRRAAAGVLGTPAERGAHA
jgi:predicted PurR-regulated permease PerM/uncharacterized membrane protein HdeD (DUF308 family)